MNQIITMSRFGMLAAVAAILLLAPAQAQGPGTEEFKGQFLSVIKKSNPGSSVDLEQVVLRTLGDKSFLVGIGTDTPDNWQKGRRVWVAMDDISEITSFPTLEELRKASIPMDEKKQVQR